MLRHKHIGVEPKEPFMKALQLAGVRRLEIVDVPLPPDPGPDDVLVRVNAVGICGTDLHS
jgi:(R,R)-butanediol dehydrogenase/meso-butanediol dehydrogenase/diacetyl reductase